MAPDKPKWIEQTIGRAVASLPPYVPGKPVAALKREMGISDALKMASNENPLGPSPLSVNAMKECLGQVHVYPEDSAPELRAALAEGFGISDDSVILGNGSDEILVLCAHLMIGPGDEAVIGGNTFSMYRIVVEAFGGKVAAVPLEDYKFDLQGMARAVNDKTRIVFLTVPNNPTGTIVSRSDFEAFLGDLPNEGLILVVDEAYREYVRDPDCPAGMDYIGGAPPVLILRTFSKFYGLAGLRIGYGLSEPWLVELLNRLRPPFNVNSMAQRAALAALGDTSYQEMSISTNNEGMEFLTGKLTALGLEVIPSQANFVSFCFRRNAGPVYEALLREGIIVRHLASFGMESCLRVTVGRMEENSRLIGELTKVLAST